MKAIITHGDKTYETDLSEPIDISIPLRGDKDQCNGLASSASCDTSGKRRKFYGKRCGRRRSKF